MDLAALVRIWTAVLEQSCYAMCIIYTLANCFLDLYTEWWDATKCAYEECIVSISKFNAIQCCCIKVAIFLSHNPDDINITIGQLSLLLAPKRSCCTMSLCHSVSLYIREAKLLRFWIFLPVCINFKTWMQVNDAWCWCLLIDADQPSRCWRAVGERNKIPLSCRRARICIFSRQKHRFLRSLNILWKQALQKISESSPKVF